MIPRSFSLHWLKRLLSLEATRPSLTEMSLNKQIEGVSATVAICICRPRRVYVYKAFSYLLPMTMDERVLEVIFFHCLVSPKIDIFMLCYVMTVNLIILVLFNRCCHHYCVSILQTCMDLSSKTPLWQENITSFLWTGNWGIEKLSDLPKVL